MISNYRKESRPANMEVPKVGMTDFSIFLCLTELWFLKSTIVKRTALDNTQNVIS